MNEPSPEQQTILDFTKKYPYSLLVEALAGSGKTTTLIEILKVLPQASAIVLAFNTRIADEMSKRLPKLPRNKLVHVKTLHSAGLWITKQHFPRLVVDKTVSEELVSRACAKGTSLKVRGAALKLLRLAKDFQHDLALDAGYAHVLASDFGVFDKIESGPDMQKVVEVTQKAYELSLDIAERTKIDFSDMTWLPLVLDLEPPSRYKAVLLDEAQDVNPNQLAMVEKLIAPGGRIIACGDKHQCHPAGTIVELTGGQRIPIERIKPGMEVVSYHDEFRGLTAQGRKVLKAASYPYEGELLTLSAGKELVRVTPNHRVPTKFVKDAKPRWALYLMEYGKTSRLGCCSLFYGGGTGSFGPSMRARHEGADRCWVLNVFESRGDALIAETLTSLRWGIPEHVFKEKGAYKRRLLHAIGDNRAEASLCLEAFGRLYEHPFYLKGEDKHVSRTYSYVTEACNLLPGLNRLRTFSGTRNGGSWVPVKISRKPFKGRVYSLAVEPTEGGRRLYVADRILVHNSIYGWRGATPDETWKILQEKYKTTSLPLTITWRCDAAIVKQANELVPDLKARVGAGPGKVDYIGESEFFEKVRYVDGSTFVLSRTNAHLLKMALEMWKRRIPFNITQSPEVIWPLKDITKKLVKEPKGSAWVSGMASFKQALSAWRVTENMKAESAGSATWAERIEEQFNMLTFCTGYVGDPEDIGGLLDTIFSQDDSCEIMLSTVHKAKGLEADHVFLLRETFKRYRKYKNENGEWVLPKLEEVDIEEKNVEYVGITRAKSALTWVYLDK
jgi:hypothetical protein